MESTTEEYDTIDFNITLIIVALERNDCIGFKAICSFSLLKIDQQEPWQHSRVAWLCTNYIDSPIFARERETNT